MGVTTWTKMFGIDLALGQPTSHTIIITYKIGRKVRSLKKSRKRERVKEEGKKLRKRLTCNCQQQCVTYLKYSNVMCFFFQSSIFNVMCKFLTKKMNNELFTFVSLPNIFLPPQPQRNFFPLTRKEQKSKSLFYYLLLFFR